MAAAHAGTTGRRVLLVVLWMTWPCAAGMHLRLSVLMAVRSHRPLMTSGGALGR